MKFVLVAYPNPAKPNGLDMFIVQGAEIDWYEDIEDYKILYRGEVPEETLQKVAAALMPATINKIEKEQDDLRGRVLALEERKKSLLAIEYKGDVNE